MKILMPLSTQGSDPTEVAIPWQQLSKAGHEWTFSTPDGAMATLDTRMITGAGLGPWRFLRARRDAREAQAALVKDLKFQKPLEYQALESGDYDALILPGGHAPGMKAYLESTKLQRLASEFMTGGKPVAAICHGVVVLARSKPLQSEKSVLFDRTVTALPKSMEMSAWLLTGLWLGNYYRTYPKSVQAEVTEALEQAKQFQVGPPSLLRDHPNKLSRAFVVRDRNLVTARWPGDVYGFSQEFQKLLAES